MESDLRILGLSGPLAQLTEAIIDKAWRSVMLKAHPDKGGSKEQCHEVTRARDALIQTIRMLRASHGAKWSSVLNCDECFGKHPNNCDCTCETCLDDEDKRAFYKFLEENPDFRDVFEDEMDRLRRQVDAANRRAAAAEGRSSTDDWLFARQQKWAAEERLKVEEANLKMEQKKAERAEFAARVAKAEAEEAAAQAKKATAEAETASAEAKKTVNLEATSSASASSSETYSREYYAKIRRELHLGKTVDGTKLTPQMVQERFDKLEARHERLPTRYQAADRKTLDELFEKYKDVLGDAVKTINEHTTNEIQGVHERLDRIESRLAGDIPPRCEQQTASDRKREIDEILPRLRHERQELLKEERAEKAAKKPRRSAPTS